MKKRESTGMDFEERAFKLACLYQRVELLELEKENIEQLIKRLENNMKRRTVIRRKSRPFPDYAKTKN